MWTVVPPPSRGVCPVTRVPVRMSMPRLLKARCNGRTTSGSAPGSRPGSASSTVTVDPRSRNIDANSLPTTPPPMTTTRPGSSVSSNTSSEVSTVLPSTSKPGSVLGTEPLASTMWRPVSSVVVPSAPVTVTVWSGPSRPTPPNTVTLRFLSRPLTPATSLSTTWSLRANSAVASTFGASLRTPNSADPATVRHTAAASSSSFAGMHPRFRQVPPTLSFSTRAMCNPAAAP